MKLKHLPQATHLGYCTNIHAGENLQEIRSSLASHLPAIRHALQEQDLLGARSPLGIGLRLSAQAAAELRQDDARNSFCAELDALGAYVFTVNAFPYGDFHHKPLKQQVYQPDWSTRERLHYTRDCAHVLAALLPAGESGSISSVPLGYRSAVPDHERHAQMLPQLLACVQELVQIERRCGRRIMLALEPEPGCLLENSRDALDFFRHVWFAPTTLRQLASLCDSTLGQADILARRHLGLCYDVCHGAVEFENPLASLQALEQAGIQIGKIQLSNALRIAQMDPSLMLRLQAFDDGVYLHQVVRRQHATLWRDADLPQALASAQDDWPQQEWRIHCHVPLFWPGAGALGATDAELRQLLQALRQHSYSSHLEVETYTWDVLPPALRQEGKAAAIARELAFVLRELQA